MATIAFIISAMPGEFNSSLKIAKSLQRRGHRVVYITAAINAFLDPVKTAKDNGFEAIPILEELADRPGLQEEIEKNPLLLRRTIRHTMSEVFRRVGEGEIDEILRKINAEFLFVDVLLPFFAMIGHRMGIPTAIYNNNCLSPWDPEVPPVNSNIIPKPGTWNRVKIAMSWRKAWAVRSIVRKLMYNDRLGFLQCAKACGFPTEKIRWDTEWWPLMDLPELVLFPKEFDFPRSKELRNRYYVEGATDVDRAEPPFDWSVVDPKRPIIYFALGSKFAEFTEQWTKPWARKLIANLFACMEAHPDWQLLAVIGKANATAPGFPTVPKNVIPLDYAPQIQILQRTNVMIGHGGLCSTKECLHYGVPMFHLPIWDDQPHTAARAEFHGIALRATNPKSVSKEMFDDSLQRLLTDPSFKAKAQAFSELFRKAEGEERAATLIEQWISEKSARPGAVA